jgi:fructokinase
VTPVGGIEAGGTKWLCAIGTGPDDLAATETIPTTKPEETIGRAIAFFEREGPVRAVGIGCFGPIDLRPGSPTWGSITTTPKPGWAHTEVAGVVGGRLGVPVAFDTEVNAAALGEHRWRAALGLDTFCYITVGIGGGAIAGGRIVQGLLHPEVGHMRIPHDLDGDPFPGSCPYHGDCWEGSRSGWRSRRGGGGRRESSSPSGPSGESRRGTSPWGSSRSSQCSHRSGSCSAAA